MTSPVRAVFRKFNPGTLQSDAEIREQFVARNRDLDLLMKALRGNVGADSCQHALVVGRRGMGKTMLLARVAAEVRGDDELSRRLLILRFTEESHEIQDLADFWCETLFHLARECAPVDSNIAAELRRVHADLTKRWRGSELEYRAQATVLEAADRLGRQLVVMVENLQALTASAGDDFGWGLRKVLQTEPAVTMIATATSRFRGLDDASAPFFELFRIIGLERLDTKDCRRLWERVSGRPIAERRVRPLEILTGGNPRLLVIVADFGRRGSLRELMEQLVALIDEHTEYFRSHLEGIARTERRVYLAVIDLWQSSTSQEIAERARLDIRTTSALLGRLVERGAVVVETVGKKRRYAAAERLWSLYYRLRRERDHAVDLRRLFRFMDAFYDAEDDSATGAPEEGRAAPLSPGFVPSGGGSSVPDAPIRLDGEEFSGGRGLAEPMVAAEPMAPYETRAPTEPWMRAEALYGAGRLEEADALVRRSVAEFDPEDTESLRGVVRGLVRLVAGGAPAGTLLDLLGGNEGHAAAMQPLMVALGRLAGREVRAPAEALEVADDLVRDIEQERQRRQGLRLHSGTG